MHAIWKFLAGRSTIGAKARMAISGLLLCGFLVTHLAGNLLMYHSADAYNKYASALHSGEMMFLLKGAEVGLFLLFAMHILLAFVTAIQNARARPQEYAMKRSKQQEVNILASPAYATMLFSGLVVLVFTVYHVVEFKTNEVDFEGHDVTSAVMETRYDTTIRLLQNPLSAGIYLLGSLFLGWHLAHGFSSALHTLGLTHPQHTPRVRVFGLVFAAVIGLGFASFPVWAQFVKAGPPGNSGTGHPAVEPEKPAGA